MCCVFVDIKYKHFSSLTAKSIIVLNLLQLPYILHNKILMKVMTNSDLMQNVLYTAAENMRHPALDSAPKPSQLKPDFYCDS